MSLCPSVLVSQCPGDPVSQSPGGDGETHKGGGTNYATEECDVCMHVSHLATEIQIEVVPMQKKGKLQVHCQME